MRSFFNLLCLFFASGFGVSFLIFSLVSRIKNLSFCSLPERWMGTGLGGSLLAFFLIYFGIEIRGWNGFFFLLFLTLFSIFVSEKAEQILKNKDDTRIVIDEIIGFFWSVAFLPHLFYASHKIFLLILGLILFRIFDVFKLPLKNVQNLKGGLGVVLDDFLAGLLTNLVLQILIQFFL